MSLNRDVKQVLSETTKGWWSLGVLAAAACGIGSVHEDLMRGICPVPEDDFGEGICLSRWLVNLYAYFRRLSSIPAVVLSVVGSAELPSFSSFDYYPFEAVERLEEECVKLLVYEDFWRNLTAHPLALFEPFGSSGNQAGQSGGSDGRSPFP
ncbi:hypothetical protein F511_14174 [Dorcoceras hygrometricum]|uniref:Uncharacterized protein n=1 Tax=Dorcoceras hygrometricum TaxID=472368 RepID=A0A2Z7CTW7_9LAMI|nr:hypothetical protein F511_14174 [Dorcoceras hygrometricum]